MSIAFEVEDLPATLTPDLDIDNIPEMACTECGVDISHLYAGRGRKPTKCEEHKKGNASRINGRSASGSADAKLAADTLDQAYSAIAMGLMLVGAQEAAASLSASTGNLKTQNVAFLTRDKELAKKINSLGKTGGRFGFYAANLMVLAPVLGLAFGEVRERTAKRNKKAAEARAAAMEEMPSGEAAGPLFGAGGIPLD